jgi:hypothetical protein
VLMNHELGSTSEPSVPMDRKARSSRSGSSTRATCRSSPART